MNTIGKTGIITAMKEEANHIIESYNLVETKKMQNLIIYENESIVLVLVGIGKIQASLGTTFLILNYDLVKIINIGIAGSLLGDNANIGDVFIVNKISQHDMYLPFDGEHLDYIKKDIIVNNNINIDFKGFNFKINNNSYCLTGDQFIDNGEKVIELGKKFNAGIIEMEAFAIASVAREFNMLDKCIFIKAISDGADSGARGDHMGNLDFAMNNSLKVLDKFL